MVYRLVVVVPQIYSSLKYYSVGLTT